MKQGNVEWIDPRMKRQIGEVFYAEMMGFAEKRRGYKSEKHLERKKWRKGEHEGIKK